MSNAETNMKIRHLNNLSFSLFLAWFFPTLLYGSFVCFLYKEILFLSLESMGDLIPSAFCFTSAMVTILFIYNEIALKPLFMLCRSRMHNYRPIYELIDGLWRGTLLCIIINLIFFGTVYLVYPSEVLRLGWRIFIELKTTFLSLVICESVMLLVLTLFSYLWGSVANHIEKDKFEDWLETDFPSFPIKSGIILFFLSLTGVFFYTAYIYYFINPSLASQTLLSSISAISFYLALSLLYYYLIKRILGRFLERHELI